VILRREQARVQLSVLPRAMSTVHGSLSAQDAGQAPAWPAVMPRSHVSVDSRMPLPQRGTQSESFVVVHPGAQHPSPLAQDVISCGTQRTSQSEVALRTQIAQPSEGGQVVGQDAGALRVSQVSQGVSTTLLPHVAGQSASIPA
jgi:hypothetical protein